MTDNLFAEHKIEFRPSLSHIDIGGVIYNGRYADIYNYARDEYMRSIGYSYKKLNETENNHLVVVQMNMKFRKPVYYDEQTDIISRVTKIGTRSITFNQKIYKDKMSVLCNESEFVMVCLNDSFKPTKVPAELVEAFKIGPR